MCSSAILIPVFSPDYSRIIPDLVFVDVTHALTATTRALHYVVPKPTVSSFLDMLGPTTRYVQY